MGTSGIGAGASDTGRRRRWLVVAVLAFGGLVALGVVLWRVVLRDTAEPASVDEAVERFRDRAEAGGGRIPAGVYVYATTGSESIDALGGARHRYPATSTITVTRSDCGAELRWDVLKTRSNVWRVCDAGDALALEEWIESHQFFGNTDRSTWACSDTSWLPADPSPGASLPYLCESSGTVQRGTTTVVGEEDVVVAGDAVPSVRLRIEADEVGSARGTLVEERWLEQESGLPLRIRYSVATENTSLIGDVTFAERYDLRLTSLEPRR